MQLFISHSHEESNVAQAVQREISQCFAKQVTVFLADQIPFGKNWFDEIKLALTASDLIIVLCSRHSISRPWMNIEAGYGVMAGKQVIPVCYPGFSKEELPEIYKLLQAVDILSQADVARLLSQIAQATKAGQFLGDKDAAVTRWLENILAAIRSTPSSGCCGHMLALSMPTDSSDVDEFNHELKCCLNEKLAGEGVKLLDYCPPDKPSNDATYLWKLREKIEKLSEEASPEYLLVVWPFLAANENQEDVLSALRRLVRGGCRIAFINEFPDFKESDPDFAGKVVCISVNERDAVKLICRYIKNRINCNSQVLLINANQTFRVAQQRKNFYEEALKANNLDYKSYDIPSWDADDTKKFVLEELQLFEKSPGLQFYDVIAAANDNMAVGAVMALHEYCRAKNVQLRTKVVGFDGLPTAMRMIKDPGSNFVATFAAHPRSYANTAFTALCKVPIFTGIGKKLIPVFEADLKTKDSFESGS